MGIGDISKVRLMRPLYYHPIGKEGILGRMSDSPAYSNQKPVTRMAGFLRDLSEHSLLISPFGEGNQDSIEIPLEYVLDAPTFSLEGLQRLLHEELLAEGGISERG